MSDFTTIQLDYNTGTDGSPTWTGLPSPSVASGANEIRWCNTSAGGASTASASWPYYTDLAAQALCLKCGRSQRTPAARRWLRMMALQRTTNSFAGTGTTPAPLPLRLSIAPLVTTRTRRLVQVLSLAGRAARLSSTAMH